MFVITQVLRTETDRYLNHLGLDRIILKERRMLIWSQLKEIKSVKDQYSSVNYCVHNITHSDFC